MPQSLDFKRRPRRRRPVLAGVVTGVALVLLGLAALAPVLPSEAALQGVGRIFDSVVPQLLAAVLALAVLVILLGQRLLALAVILAVLAVGGVTGARHVARSDPLVAEAEARTIRVLWFNVLSDNPRPPEEMVRAVNASGADVVVLAEASHVETQLAGFERAYPYQLGCRKPCNLLVLSRLPLDAASLRNLSFVSRERYAQIPLDFGARSLTLVAAHMLKPWYDEWAVLEENVLIRALDRIDGPVLVVGDFNSAPWSLRMRRIADATGARFVRLPPATWPVEAGRLGVPIDNALTRDGVRLAGIERWGGDLGSNHAGLMLTVVLPPGPPADG